MKGGDILVETLKAFGTEYIFGLPAGEALNYCWIQADKMGIKTILIRNEMSGALMADGYARVSFKPGISIFGQVGAMYEAAGVIEAFHSSIPTINITHTGGSRMYSMAHGHRESHYVNMPPLFDEITKWTVQIDRVDQIHALIKRAFKVATTGRPGPVVAILRDEEIFKEVDVEIGKEPEYAHYPALRIGPNRESIEKAAGLLIKAERPVIYAGSGVILSQAWDELKDLAELLGAPVATTHQAKGVFPDTHPLSIGTGGRVRKGLRGVVANSFVREADLVLIIGTKMTWFTTYNFGAINAKLIQIDVDPFEIGKNYPVEIGIVGDAKLSLRNLVEVLKAKISKKKLEDLSIVKEIQKRMKVWLDEASVDMNSDAVPIKVARLMKELKSFIDKNTFVYLGASTAGTWGMSRLDALTAGRTFMQPCGLSSLGFDVPMALGVKVGVPDKRVFCLVGDGSFNYTLGDLETAVRNNLNVIYVVLNNLCWGAEKRTVEEKFGETTHLLDNSPMADYGKVMEAMGGYGALVEEPGEIREAIARAIEANKPAVLDVRVDYKDTHGPSVQYT